MSKLLPSLTIAACIVVPGLAVAQTSHKDSHSGMHHGAGETKQGAAAVATDGTIRKIDKAAGKVTIKHGPIANLNMPPMTMAFKVKDAALLDKVKVGDQVAFVAESLGGALTVTELKLAN